MTTNTIQDLDNHTSGDGMSDSDNGSTAKKVITTVGSAVSTAASTVKDATVSTAKKVAESERVAAASTKVKDVATSDNTKAAVEKHRSKVLGIAGAFVVFLAFRQVRSARQGRKA